MCNLQSAVGADAVRASRQTFFPKATVKCEGPVVFRSQAARDVACLLDVDTFVKSWTCNPPPLLVSDNTHFCDFSVLDVLGCETLMDAPDRDPDLVAEELRAAAHRLGFDYDRRERGEVYKGFRLRNAKDLLRYANYRVPLGDRVKLLAALEEHGSLTVAECLTAFSETKPIGGLACLILNGFVEVDLDEGLIGPGTAVKRISA